ncbi:MAG: HPF/RaiA family ribosome-associated protein [Byssovorax sp.]
MRFEVKDRGFQVAEGLRNYVGLRLMSVLDHHVRRVDGVTVCLTDIHAPGGVIDKRCRMVLRLAAAGEVGVEETAPGLYAAIDQAAERLARAVTLELASRDRTAAPLGPMEEHMRIHVRSRGFDLTKALRAHAERRLLFALGRFGRRLQSVMLRMDDVNGPRGGADKRCQIVARLAPGGDVRVEELDGDLYAAIDRAADRFDHTVAREMERRREVRKGDTALAEQGAR